MKSQNKPQGQKIEIKKEINTYQRTNSRGQSQGKEINTSQRQSSRRESQNQKSQVVKEVTATTSVNRRNAGTEPTVNTTKTVTAVKKTNYEFKPTGKPTGKKVHTGLSISSTNRINVKEQDHNKRQNVPSAKKADISQTNISKEKTEIKIKKEPMAKKDTKEKKEEIGEYMMIFSIWKILQ